MGCLRPLGSRVSKQCPESPESPESVPRMSGTLFDTLTFLGTLLGILQDTSGPKAQETPVVGRRGSQA